MPRPLSHLKARPRQERSQETLARVLRATEHLLGRMHFEDITISQILELAGVSVGSFYARFHSKEDLLPHLYTAYSENLKLRTAAAANPEHWAGKKLAERIRTLLALAVATYREQHGLLRAVALLARSRPKQVAKSALRERDDQYRVMAALLLACRDEIRHPAPDRAVQTGLLFALAACRDKILFAEAPHPASVPLTDAQLADELARALHAYLTTLPPF